MPRQPDPKCSVCYRAPRDGCSHTACPCRRSVTARPQGTPAQVALSTGQRAFEPHRFERDE